MNVRPASWLVWLGVVVAMAATARLGVWQLDRAAQKTAIAEAWRTRAQLEPLAASQLPREPADVAAALHRRIVVEGRWLTRHTLFLDNRTQHGVAGFVVVTPLLIAPGDAVLVQRGWAPRDAADRTRAAGRAAAEGTCASKRASPPGRRRGWRLSSAVEHGPIRQNLNPAQLAREVGTTLRPLSLLQLSAPRPLRRAAARLARAAARRLETPGLCTAMVRAVCADRRLGALVRLDFTATTWTKKLNRWR